MSKISSIFIFKDTYRHLSTISLFTNIVRNELFWTHWTLLIRGNILYEHIKEQTNNRSIYYTY